MSCTMSSNRISSQNQTLESTPKFGIENGIDNRIHKRVHVADPSGIEEDIESDLAFLQIESNTNTIEDVYREEGHPTDQKHS